jgi:hypothetical protein
MNTQDSKIRRKQKTKRFENQRGGRLLCDSPHFMFLHSFSRPDFVASRQVEKARSISVFGYNGRRKFAAGTVALNAIGSDTGGRGVKTTDSGRSAI